MGDSVFLGQFLGVAAMPGYALHVLYMQDSAGFSAPTKVWGCCSSSGVSEPAPILEEEGQNSQWMGTGWVNERVYGEERPMFFIS